ncbi:Speckle-type POZ protein B-like protein [Aphelenchoides besseyi]|nr:Speckle-type POZ protein B-like protein [Aphelenchoides besseyi]
MTSEPFAVEHPEFGEIEFYLRFKPKLIRSCNYSDVTTTAMESSSERSISIECYLWMETIDKKRTETKTVTLSTNEDSSINESCVWPLGQTHMFLQSATVFICCRMPYRVKSIGWISTKTTLYRWPISGFEARFNAAQFKTMWESQQFEVPEFEGVKFTVQFYPKNLSELKRNGCSIFVNIEGLADNARVPIHCGFWIENAENRLRKLELTHVFTTNENYGYAMYVKQQQLRELSQNGIITICCDVRAIIDFAPLPDNSFQCELASFLNDPFFSDAEIRVDHKVFKVCRAIVSSKSPVFRGMFGNKCIEQESGVVIIDGFEAPIVEKMLIYIYKNEVVNLRKDAAELLRVADCYQVNALVKKCTESILDNLIVENLLSTLELAFELDHLRQFKDRVLKFAHENCTEMQELPEYEDLLKKVPQIAIELFGFS